MFNLIFIVKVEALSDVATQEVLDRKLDNISSLLRMVAPDCKRMVLICRSFIKYIKTLFRFRVCLCLMLRVYFC